MWGVASQHLPGAPLCLPWGGIAPAASVSVSTGQGHQSWFSNSESDNCFTESDCDDYIEALAQCNVPALELKLRWSEP